MHDPIVGRRTPGAISSRRWTLLILATLQIFAGSVRLSAEVEPELRGFWVDAWHAGFKTPGQVTELVADLRAANCNAVFVQVRRRGDAYYDSNLEPKAADIDGDFDPLADLIKKARETRDGGQRIEVHAWIVAYPVWPGENRSPSQPDHPYSLHPEWLTKNIEGETYSGRNHGLDPGHPGVQRHLLDVAMDLVTRYNIDGLHLDHIRYLDTTWGYNDVTVERFNRLHEREGLPPTDDEVWLQYRRDQVTDLVRSIYLEILSTKPELKVSAAVNTRAPGITTTEQWPSSAAYSSTLQDWRAWLEEGIIDLAIPMAYMDMDGRWGSAWERWNIFAKDHRYNRHVALGTGNYLNSIANGIGQIRTTRERTEAGNRADGVVFYSYFQTDKERSPRAAFIEALVEGEQSGASPVFADPAPTPEMPWKSDPVLGHLKGKFHTGRKAAGIADVTIAVEGPEKRVLRSSATGEFGTVDLPPGEYTLTATLQGRPVTGRAVVKAGEVARVEAVAQ